MIQMAVLNACSYAWFFFKNWISRNAAVSHGSDSSFHLDQIYDVGHLEPNTIGLHSKTSGMKFRDRDGSEEPLIPDYLEDDVQDHFPNLPDYSRYLTDSEAKEIIRQFDKIVLRPGCQVMWSGVPRTWVQDWADRHDLQTLSTAMGPLMDTQSVSCRKSSMTPAQWSDYVRGASILFASYLPKGHRITVLTMPPPVRFNPTGGSTYQRLEEPILKGHLGGQPVLKIEIVHFTVKGLEDARYQVWPLDEVDGWIKASKAFIPVEQHKYLKQCTWSQMTQ